MCLTGAQRFSRHRPDAFVCVSSYPSSHRQSMKVVILDTRQNKVPRGAAHSLSRAQIGIDEPQFHPAARTAMRQVSRAKNVKPTCSAAGCQERQCKSQHVVLRLFSLFMPHDVAPRNLLYNSEQVSWSRRDAGLNGWTSSMSKHVEHSSTPLMIEVFHSVVVQARKRLPVFGNFSFTCSGSGKIQQQHMQQCALHQKRMQFMPRLVSGYRSAYGCVD